jgi:photosystem II stability/assembly factor-like uncharacterized protein
MHFVVHLLVVLGVLLGSASTAAAQAQTQTTDCSPRGHNNYRTQNTLAVDPDNPNVVWVAVEFKGIYKSTDGGATWAKKDRGITGYAMANRQSDTCLQEMGRIVARGDRVLMSPVGSPGTLAMPNSEHGGLWESQDGGDNWQQILKPDLNASGSRALVVRPDNAAVIYQGVNNNRPSWQGAPDRLFNTSGIIYRTTDGGASWHELPTGAPDGLRALYVFINPTNFDHLWSIVWTTTNDGGNAAAATQWSYIESTDGGATWQRGGERLPADYRIPAEGAVARANFNNRLFIAQTMQGEQRSFYTTNGGQSWSAMPVYTFVARYNPYDETGRHVVGYVPYSNQPGLMESRDGGATWARLSDLPSEVDNRDQFGVRISEIVWHVSDRNTLYMSGSGGYVWKSTDAGRTWRTVLSLDQIGGRNP